VSAEAASADRIEMSVPLRNEYASTIRTVAAALGADAGFSIDELDDIRLALSEVFTALADEADRGRAHVSFVMGDGTVRIEVRADGSSTVDLDELALAILRSVTDRFEVVDGVIVLVKNATEAAAGPVESTQRR
jgi:anti-sigma regulatory factor (Ser/Thr protein kinase)